MITANVGDATVGAYINIDLFKQVPGYEKSQITETAAPVKLTITVPETIAAAPKTGDVNTSWMWMLLVAGIGIVVAGYGFFRRKED